MVSLNLLPGGTVQDGMSTNSILHNISIDLWVIRSRPERYGCAHLNVKEKSNQLIYPKQNQFPKARNIDRDHHKTGTQPGIRSPQLNPKPSGAPSFARLIGRRVGNAHSLPGLLCLCLSSLLITRYSLLVHKSPLLYPTFIPPSSPFLFSPLPFSASSAPFSALSASVLLKPPSLQENPHP
jgi:hypothetical protein